MVESRPHGGPSRFEVVPKVDTHFAWLRTRMALERTMMAWIRTGVALIGFGFTIFQFIERFNATPGVARAARPHAPQVLGLALIGTGIIALVLAVNSYRAFTRYLWSEEYEPVAGVAGAPKPTPILGVTLVLILAGVFAFLAVLLRFP